jgi:hypothetical protein
MQKPSAHLYFIENPHLSIVKIGRTRDVQQRLKELECGCGVSLRLLRVFENVGMWEQRVHDSLSASRLVGEWFTLTDDLRAAIMRAPFIDDFIDEWWHRNAIDIQKKNGTWISKTREVSR